MPGRPADLDAPETVREDSETHLHFREGGERLATVTVRHRTASADRVPVGVHLWHRQGTRVESVGLELRSPPGGAGTPAPVYLEVPGGNPFPDLSYRTDRRNGATLVDIDDLGAQGEGTFSLAFLVLPRERDGPVEVRVRTAFTLSAGALSRYRGVGATTVGAGGEQA